MNKEQKEFHYVTIECDCEHQQILVADEKDEDCNAYDLASTERGRCEICGKTKQINVFSTENAVEM